MLDITVVVPFFNPPIQAFKECLKSLEKLSIKEVACVDDCSTDMEAIELARKSGFTYLKTPYQSGHDALPFNVGLEHSKSDYVCKVDADDILLDLPEKMEHSIHLARQSRVVSPENVTIEQLILAPRSIHNGAVIERELMLKTKYEESSAYFSDVLTVLRLLYRGYSFSVHEKVNYYYRKTENSIQTSKPNFYHRRSKSAEVFKKLKEKSNE